MSKRQAGVQITKDDYDKDEIGSEEPTGTWQKADDAVLAQRNIRKAKRPPPRTAETTERFGTAVAPTGESNPFANISLVAGAPSSAASSAAAFGAAFAGATSSGFLSRTADAAACSSSGDSTNLTGNKRMRLVVAVGSKNPVKVNSVRAAFSLAFPAAYVDCAPYDVPSGVPDQVRPIIFRT